MFCMLRLLDAVTALLEYNFINLQLLFTANSQCAVFAVLNAN